MRALWLVAVVLVAGAAHAQTPASAKREKVGCLTFVLPAGWKASAGKGPEGFESKIYSPPGDVPAPRESIEIRTGPPPAGATLAGTAAQAREVLGAGAVVDTKIDGVSAFQTIVVRPIDQKHLDVKLREISLNSLIDGRWYSIRGAYPLAREDKAKVPVEGFFQTLKVEGVQEAMSRTLIKNGTCVTASDTFAADVIIDGTKIAGLVQAGSAPGAFDKTIDAKGKYVIPGGIDAHTHLDMPFGGTSSIDDFDSGTAAAAYGGTTTIVDFAIQKKGGTLREALDTWHGKAEGKAHVDYAFHMITTDVPPAVLDEMGQLVKEGVTSFKMFMAYPGVFLLDDQSIFRAMLRAGELGALVCMHAETGLPIDVLVEKAIKAGHTAPIYHALTRPEVAEATGTERAIALAEMAKVPVYLVHLSAQRALERVMEGRDRGLPVYAETCPQYLFLSEDDLRGKPAGTGEGEFEGAKYVCTPPLRPKHHHDHLWRGLRNHDLQVVSTDHCPFCMKGQKELGKGDFSKIPNGMPGIETRLHLLYEGVRDGRISLNRFVEITSTAPAKIFGLYPRKGTIAVGADADVVVWDPERKQSLSHDALHMRADYAAYEGKTVVGSPSQVLSRGEVVVDDGKLLTKKGRGQFVKRSTFSL